MLIKFWTDQSVGISQDNAIRGITLPKHLGYSPLGLGILYYIGVYVVQTTHRKQNVVT